MINVVFLWTFLTFTSLAPATWALSTVLAQVDAESSKLQEGETPNPKEPEVDQYLLKWNELRTEYDRLQLKADDLQRQLEKAQQDNAGSKKAFADINARLNAVEKEKNQMAGALTEARDQARDLSTKLAAEQVKAATLREDKQRLMSGTTTAKEEIAKLQKRAGELETEAARADDLSKRLAERDQEIERLRKIAADRESLATKVTALTDKLERAKQQLTSVTEELSTRNEEAARVRQERDQLLLENQKRQEGLKAGEGNLSTGIDDRLLGNGSQDRTKLTIEPANRAALPDVGKRYPQLR